MTSHPVDGRADLEAAPPVERLTRVVLRPYASPLPLGFLALAVGSCLVTALQLGWVPVRDAHPVAIAVLTFVFPLEFLTTVVAFLVRDVVMATGLGLLSGSWATVGALLLSGSPGATSPVVGIVAISGAVALLVPAVTAAPAKPVATVVMFVAAARFAATGGYELGATPGWQTAAGVIGVALLVTALYGSLALSLEDARHRAVLPIKRRTTSDAAFSGDLTHQLRSLPTEAGVRQET
jgi:hypothetical protein